MKPRWITFVLFLVILVVLIVRVLPRGGRHAQDHSQSDSHAAPANAFMGLRTLVLEGSRANFGLEPGTSATQPFAVVTDWGDAQGATTIVAVADGSASVYRSSGGGSIGGGQSHESIRNAALRTVEVAAAAQPLMHATKQYPLAARGQVCFYVVTDVGVFTATASEDDIESNRSPYSLLAKAARNIIAEYRRVSDSK
jgi:hypothetical protein